MEKIEDDLIQRNLIPLDKSWIIRMGVLDLINGSEECINFLERQDNLNADLKALLNASKQWKISEDIEVGESGTLYRFLQFASWKLNLNKKFVKCKTLLDRKMNEDPSIVNWKIEELLKLDNNTSQWASASILLGNKEFVENPPFKLTLSYEAVRYYYDQKDKGKSWEPRYDKTILNQAKAFIEILNTHNTTWKPVQSEDYCFARAFEIISKEEGQERWPNLVGNETNRFEEIEKCLTEAERGKAVLSRDHRVVQAIAMLYHIKKIDVKFYHPECVSKSWPEFWDFIESFS